jgi:guanylate kinase
VEISRRGLMLVLSSPSGAGKTTISREILKRDQAITMSISATTREMRPGEEDGKDYIFLSHDDFLAKVSEGYFLEHADVFGNFYGTPKAPVEEILSDARDVLFDVDWQGTQALADSAHEDLVSVFILPPSLVELERRLKIRAQDADDVVKKRMAKASDEMSHWPEYDYIIVNRDIEDSIANVASILAAERLKRDRQEGLHAFVSELSARN